MKPLWAHQLVHGYKRGHRLLAGSTSLSTEALRLIDRLSDAAGMSVSRDPSGYLTGYPLPHGDYALAKTWPAPEAERPNVVWTHTLVLPQAALSAISMQPVVELFRRPQGHADLQSYTEPLPLGHLTDRTPEPNHDVSAPAVITALYWGEPGAWLSAAAAPEELCLAIWSQQWPRLRRSFSFCSEALEPRRLDGKAFDLLLAPDGHRKGPSVKGQEAPPAEAVHALVHDLRFPGKLRHFLRECGADSGQLRSVPLLTNAWIGARKTLSPSEVLAGVAAQTPEPSSLRRLKRKLLRGPNSLLSNADPVQTLWALAAPDIGDRVLAEDADVDVWATRAWQADRRAVLSLAGVQPGAFTAAGQPQTAAAAVPSAALAVVLDRAAAADLGMLVTETPSVAEAVLAKHREAEWWEAWANLPDNGRVLAHVAMRDEERADLAATALLKHPDGASTWTTLGRHSAVAVRGLLSAAARTGKALPEQWARALGSAADKLIAQAEEGLPAPMLAVAADAMPYVRSGTQSQWSAWKALAVDDRLWRKSAVRAAVVLAAALRGQGTEADAAAAAAFAQLHEVFAKDQEEDAWRVIHPSLPGRADDWDRCRRLEQGMAKAVLGRNAPARPSILAYMSTGKPRNALGAELQQLASEATKREQSKGPFDDWFGFLRR